MSEMRTLTSYIEKFQVDFYKRNWICTKTLFIKTLDNTR